MSARYATVGFDNKFAIQNVVDGDLLKSKDSGKVIAFAEKKKADEVRDIFQEHFNKIAEVNEVWMTRINLTDGSFMIKGVA